mgnify:CR=1 FL=1
MKTTVAIIESEAGWGQKVDELIDFDTYEEAENFVSEYNTKYNSQKKVPGWYMMAQIQH